MPGWRNPVTRTPGERMALMSLVGSNPTPGVYFIKFFHYIWN